MSVFSFEAVGIHGPNKGAGNVQEVCVLCLQSDGFLVIIADPVGPVDSVRRLVAVVDHCGPASGVSGQSGKWLSMQSTLDFLIAPKTVLASVESSGNTRVSRTI